TANQVPNIIYDIVLGGALTGAVVPVLAGVAARRGAAHYLDDAAHAGPANPPGQSGPGGGGATGHQAGRGAGGGEGADRPWGGGAAGLVAGAEAGRTASALLPWTVLLLAPASVVIALAAEPLVSLLLAGSPGCDSATTGAVSSRMLVVFAPQILLYGLAVVLY